MTDFRALCAELLDELELWSSWHDATDLKDRAGSALHFALAEQPVGPTVPNLDCDEIEVPAYYRGDEFHAYRHGFASGWAKAVTKQPAATPIPVAERLPFAECDEDQKCWWYVPEGEHWCLASQFVARLALEAIHWLPANALPVPAND
jgi:hypothetical protein